MRSLILQINMWLKDLPIEKFGAAIRFREYSFLDNPHLNGKVLNDCCCMLDFVVLCGFISIALMQRIKIWNLHQTLRQIVKFFTDFVVGNL